MLTGLYLYIPDSPNTCWMMLRRVGREENFVARGASMLVGTCLFVICRSNFVLLRLSARHVLSQPIICSHELVKCNLTPAFVIYIFYQKRKSTKCLGYGLRPSQIKKLNNVTIFNFEIYFFQVDEI